jgi:hypothetical protein
MGKSQSPNVVVLVRQELAQNVDGHDAKTAVSLDLKHGQDGFVENGVPDVLRAVSVGRDLRLIRNVQYERCSANLSQYVVHGLTGLRIAPAQDAHETEDLDLQERIRDAGNVVFGAVASRDERLQ